MTGGTYLLSAGNRRDLWHVLSRPAKVRTTTWDCWSGSRPASRSRPPRRSGVGRFSWRPDLAAEDAPDYPWRAFLPWATLTFLLLLAGNWLMGQPMEMRDTFLG